MNKIKTLLKFLVIFFKEKVLRIFIIGGISVANINVAKNIYSGAKFLAKDCPGLLSIVGVCVGVCVAGGCILMDYNTQKELIFEGQYTTK